MLLSWLLRTPPRRRSSQNSPSTRLGEYAQNSLGCRLTPEPGGPSRDDNHPPEGYKLAYSPPCAKPNHHLPEEAPRLYTPVHVPVHVTPEPRVLPPLQVRVPYNQHRSYDSGHERGEHGPGESPTPHQIGGD